MNEVIELSYKSPSIKFGDEESFVTLYTWDCNGNFVELEGGGYCPQKYSSKGIRFPTATADWKAVYGVASGPFRKIKSFDHPITLKAGDTLSISLQVSYG